MKCMSCIHLSLSFSPCFSLLFLASRTAFAPNKSSYTYSLSMNTVSVTLISSRTVFEIFINGVFVTETRERLKERERREDQEEKRVNSPPGDDDSRGRKRGKKRERDTHNKKRLKHRQKHSVQETQQ